MNDFDRNFKRTEKIFWFIFVIVVLFILFLWVLTAILGYNMITDPEGVGEYIGKIVKGATK